MDSRTKFPFFSLDFSIFIDFPWGILNLMFFFFIFRTSLETPHDFKTVHAAENKKRRGKRTFGQNRNNGLLSPNVQAEIAVLRWVSIESSRLRNIHLDVCKLFKKYCFFPIFSALKKKIRIEDLLHYTVGGDTGSNDKNFTSNLMNLVMQFRKVFNEDFPFFKFF